jgi:hypothetical protein
MMEFEAHQKNTKEQYEALGQLVEAFERMVNEARSCSIDIITKDLNEFQKRLIATPFFHPGVGAKPLYEIFIALVTEALKSEFFRMGSNIDADDLPCFPSILSELSAEYNDLCNKRNNLLHGTWYVGYQNGADFASTTFHISRFAVGASGLVPIPMPTTAAELLKLTERCMEAQNWIAVVHASLMGQPGCKIRGCFQQYQASKKKKRWERTWPSLGRLHTELV